MRFKSSSYCFASVCILAVTVAEAKTREEFSVDRAKLERNRLKNGLAVHPDSVPNWMRGFFDDFQDEGHFYHGATPLS